MVATFTDLQKSREIRTFLTGFAVPSEKKTKTKQKKKKKTKTEIMKLAYVKISLKQNNLLSIVMFKIF